MTQPTIILINQNGTYLKNDGHGSVETLNYDQFQSLIYRSRVNRINFSHQLRKICLILIELFGCESIGKDEYILGGNRIINIINLMELLNNDIFKKMLWETIWCDYVYHNYISNSQSDYIVIGDCLTPTEIKYFSDFNYQMMEKDISMKSKLIIVTGEAGNGKDTTVDYIIQKLKKLSIKSIKLALADKLKFICHDLIKIFMGIDVPINYFFDNLIKDKFLPEYPAFDLKVFKIRNIMQTIGTKVFRECLWADLWCDYLYRLMITLTDYDYIYISDCRIPNEFKYFTNGNRFGNVPSIRVERSINKQIDETNSKHFSESQINLLPVKYIINNNSTLDILYLNIDKLCHHLNLY